MISIIIPTYNEAERIQANIERLWQYNEGSQIKEIIIVDGSSTDDTVHRAKAAGAKVVNADRKGRAVQMNFGASIAQGEILYFLHADTIPPPGFINDIMRSIAKGYVAGCYRLSFDFNHWFLKANCWFTRFNVNAVRFGDQSLFVKKDVFYSSGRFREDLLMMEDQEIIGRIKKKAGFR